MSRAFAGTNETITFSVGNAPPDQGPFTYGALVKMVNGYGWVGNGTSSWAMGSDAGLWFMWNDFTAGNSSGIAAGNWMWVVVTKASGSATPRWHFKNVTAGSAWTHTNAGGTVPDNTGPPSALVAGNYPSGGTGSSFNGEQAVQAACDIAMTDLQVEAAFTLNASDTLTAVKNGTTKYFMWRFNQAAVTTSVTDDTGGGANQTARSGTSVGLTDPPGYNYSITTTITKDLTINWRVLNARTKDLTVNWRVLNAVTKDSILKWRVLNAGTKDLTALWRVLNSGTKDLVLKWRVLNAITKDVTLLWRVLNSGNKDLVLKWLVLNALSKDLTLKWDVLSATTVTKDMILRWRVLNAGTADVVLRWNVLNAGTKDIVLRWRVLNPGQKDIVLKWDVFTYTHGTKDLILKWLVLGAQQRDLILRWRVLSATPAPPLPADVVAYLEDEARAILTPESVIARL